MSDTETKPWTVAQAIAWDERVGQPWQRIANAENAAADALLAHLRTKRNRRKNAMYRYYDTYELRRLAVAMIEAIDADRAFMRGNFGPQAEPVQEAS